MENNWKDNVSSSLEEMANEMEKEVESFPTEEEVKEKIATTKKKTTTTKKKTTTTEKETEINEETVDNKKSANNSQITAKDFLNNLKFDVSNIKIVEESLLKETKNFEFIMNNKSKTQIVANQSNYIAYVEGLNYNEISALSNSTLDDYAAQLLLAQTIYSKINTTSLGTMSFSDWSSITSFYDIDSFLYGIYLETFPGDTKFSITCGHCKGKIDAVINNDTLITGKNEDALANVQRILNNKNDSKEILKDALINHKERIVLPDSKIIMDIKVPTIKKHLDILGSVNKNAKDKTQHILSVMMFLDNVFMIDLEKSMQTNEACYYEIKQKEKIARIISQLSFNDAKEVTKFINDFIDKNALEYKIKSFKCPSCQEDIGDIPVDMETLLFYQILQL